MRMIQVRWRIVIPFFMFSELHKDGALVWPFSLAPSRGNVRVCSFSTGGACAPVTNFRISPKTPHICQTWGTRCGKRHFYVQHFYVFMYSSTELTYFKMAIIEMRDLDAKSTHEGFIKGVLSHTGPRWKDLPASHWKFHFLPIQK